LDHNLNPRALETAKSSGPVSPFIAPNAAVSKQEGFFNFFQRIWLPCVLLS